MVVYRVKAEGTLNQADILTETNVIFAIEPNKYLNTSMSHTVALMCPSMCRVQAPWFILTHTNKHHSPTVKTPYVYQSMAANSPQLIQ